MSTQSFGEQLTLIKFSQLDVQEGDCNSGEVYAALHMLLAIATYNRTHVAITSSMYSTANTSQLLPRSDRQNAGQIVGLLALNL